MGVTDLLVVLSDWDCRGDCLGDVNGDGGTTVLDLLQILADWGSTLPD